MSQDANIVPVIIHLDFKEIAGLQITEVLAMNLDEVISDIQNGATLFVAGNEEGCEFESIDKASALKIVKEIFGAQYQSGDINKDEYDEAIGLIRSITYGKLDD